MLDLDNTLAERDVAFDRWLTAKLREWNLADDPQARSYAVSLDDGGARPRSEFLDSIRRRFGLEASTEQLLSEYRAAKVAGLPRLPAATRERLIGIRRAGWKIAVVSNGAGEVQEASVKQIGADDLIDACVVSGHLGIRKPEPGIFAAAAERCGTTLAGAVMVGDSVVDVLGARACGIASIWISHGRDWEGDSVVPDHVVDDLDAALERVAGMSEARRDEASGETAPK